MGTLKYDVTDVERGGGQSKCKPGLYNGKITSAIMEIEGENLPEGKKDRIHVIIELTSGESKGDKIHDFVHTALESTRWKLGEFLDACSLNDKGKLTWDDKTHECKGLKGKKIKISVKGDTYEGEYVAKVKRLLAFDADPDEEDLEDEDDGDEEEEEEEEEESLVDYSGFSLKKLKAEAKDRDIDIEGLKKDDLILALEVDDQSDDDEDEDEDEEEEEEEEKEKMPDYGDMSLKELKAEAKDRNVEFEGLKKREIIEALSEADRLDSDDADDDDEDEEDYTEWSTDDLKKECKERELPIRTKLKGSKLKNYLIKKIEEDDEDNPFDGDGEKE